MTSLLENPMPVVYLSAVALAILVVALVKSGRGRLIWAIAGVFLVAAVVTLVSWLVETDREKIVAALRGGAKAVENNDLDQFLSFIAPESQIVRRARSQLPRFQFSKVSFLDEPKIDIQGDHARAAVNVVLMINGMRGGRFVTVDFRREGERWLAVDLRDEDLDIKDVFR
jgi:hypothetical protein